MNEKTYQGNKRVDDIVKKARESLEEAGDMHSEGCPCNMESPDACDCDNMEFLEKEVRTALEALDKYWLFHLNAHRKHCSPDGNKELTKIKRNKIS